MQMFSYNGLPSTSKLKSDITSLCRPPSRDIFGVHDPSGLHYIFQLRLNLSPLREHKWRYNFADTTSNICRCKEDKEDTRHYFFSCSLFKNQREILLTSVKEILQKYSLDSQHKEVEIYLYGHHSISRIDNKNIILATIKYIKDTNRLTNPY